MSSQIGGDTRDRFALLGGREPIRSAFARPPFGQPHYAAGELSSGLEDERHIGAFSELFGGKAAMLRSLERPLCKPVRKLRNAVEVGGNHTVIDRSRPTAKGKP